MTNRKVKVLPGPSYASWVQNCDSGMFYLPLDTLGTWQKCVKATEEALAGGASVAVDNTNVDVSSRSRYVQIATSVKCGLRCLWLTTSMNQARHNEMFRQLTGEKHEKIGPMTKFLLWKYYNEKLVFFSCEHFLNSRSAMREHIEEKLLLLTVLLFFSSCAILGDWATGHYCKYANPCC
ncbi:unnamed protein product [Protopolystoma xenopodis]|uniref:Uncharacterized protein n=1 Tax=Protopolystoma xenopodis TaxID=117903 RepID=A0A3S5AVE9_9PLAT|nr:unnamed protein product [Protopolystoma xenopodis]